MIYTASFNEVSISAVQDLFEILAPSDAVLVVKGFGFSQSSDAGDSESEQLHTSLRLVSGAPTSGSGGSTPTPAPRELGGVASGVTCEANNTTQLSGGTNTILHTAGFNVMAGVEIWLPPESQYIVSPGTRLVWELETAPSDAITGSGWIQWEELGG